MDIRAPPASYMGDALLFRNVNNKVTRPARVEVQGPGRKDAVLLVVDRVGVKAEDVFPLVESVRQHGSHLELVG